MSSSRSPHTAASRRDRGFNRNPTRIDLRCQGVENVADNGRELDAGIGLHMLVELDTAAQGEEVFDQAPHARRLLAHDFEEALARRRIVARMAPQRIDKPRERGERRFSVRGWRWRRNRHACAPNAFAPSIHGGRGSRRAPRSCRRAPVEGSARHRRACGARRAPAPNTRRCAHSRLREQGEPPRGRPRPQNRRDVAPRRLLPQLQVAGGIRELDAALAIENHDRVGDALDQRLGRRQRQALGRRLRQFLAEVLEESEADNVASGENRPAGKDHRQRRQPGEGMKRGSDREADEDRQRCEQEVAATRPLRHVLICSRPAFVHLGLRRGRKTLRARSRIPHPRRGIKRISFDRFG